MPDPLVVLSREFVAVEPGGQASVTVTVTNTGKIVEGYRLEVLGPGVADWAAVEPAEVRVLPRQFATATIVFSPPSGPGAPGGTYPFGVKAQSLVDADGSAVAEGDLEVGKVLELQAKIVPVTSSGRWGGRHTVQISNWGSGTARLQLVASDPDEALGFLIRPPGVIEVPVGSTTVARVRVRTRHPVLRGSPERLPFTIVGEPDGARRGPVSDAATPDRPIVRGTFSQKPILGRALVPVMLLAVLAIAAGVFYERSLDRPAVSTLGDGTVPKVQGLVATKVDTASIQLSWPKLVGVDEFRIVQRAGQAARKRLR